jgi:glycosyltransferase involved in cell wall biosynthesis
MEPIRVLQVVTTMERAGLETMIMNYYRNMDRSRVQFDFLRHRDGVHAYDEEIRALGGRIYTVPAFNPLNTNGYLDELDAFFRSHRDYAVVHSHLDCLSAVPLKYAKKYGIPTRIAHSHVCRMTLDLKYPIRMFYRSRIPAVATDLFACSKDAGKWMFGSRSFTTVRNAIDCGAFAYDAEAALRLRQQHGLDDAFVLAHVGRFDPVKNHTFLLDVFSRIVQQHPNSILLLAGTGSTMSAVKSRAQTLGLQDNFRFLGSVSNVAQLLTMADVFVFPSLYEGLGISLIEAQASGLPCFTALDCVPEEANVTGTVEYLPLEAGAAAWAEAILGAQNDQHARKSNVDVLCRQGYDIIAEAEKLQQFYLQKTVEAP